MTKKLHIMFFSLMQVPFSITVISIVALTGVRHAAKPSVDGGTWKGTSTRASTDVRQTGNLTQAIHPDKVRVQLFEVMQN